MKPLCTLILSLALASASQSVHSARQAGSSPPRDEGVLVLERTEDRDITGAAPHAWKVDAREGQYIELSVENTDVDVSIAVVGSDGAQHRNFDHEGYAGSQTVRWISSAGIDAHVRIATIGPGAAGRYRITLVALRDATDRDRAIVEADGLLELAAKQQADRHDGEAESTLRRALQTVEHVSGASSLDTASVLDKLADTYYGTGRYRESVALLERSLQIKQDIEGPTGPVVGLALNNLGFMYQMQGQYAEAEPVLNRALEIRAPLLGPDHPRVGITLDNIATGYTNLGRYAEGEARARRALGIFERSLGVNHYYVSFPLNILASIYQLQGQHREAEPLLKRAMAVDEAELGSAHPNFAGTLSRLGSNLLHQGQYAESEALYRRALDINEKALGTNHPRVAGNLWNLARVHSRREEYAAARALFERALSIEKQALGTRHPSVASTLIGLARAELAAGRLANRDITAMVDEALRILDESPSQPEARIDGYALRSQLRRKEDDRKGAIADLAESLRLVEELRPQISGGEQSRAGYFESYANHFNRMVSWQLEAGDIERAFDYAERRHARVLLDQLAAGQVDLRASIAADVRRDLERREGAATARLAEFQQRITLMRSRKDLSDAERLGQIKTLEASLQAADQDYRAVYADIKNASPLWRDQVTTGGRPASLMTVQRELVPRRGLLLLYQIGNDESQVFVVPPPGEAPTALTLIINEAQARALKVSAGAVTAAALQTIVGASKAGGVISALASAASLRGLQREDPVIRSAQLHALWQVLVPEALRTRLRAAHEVVVIPDGPLHHLPFEALVTRVGDRADELRYWLDDGPVTRYAPSATVLYNLTRREQAGASSLAGGPSVLTVSDPIYDPADVRIARGAKPATASEPQSTASLQPRTRDSYERLGGSLVRLPGTARETEAISTAYGTEAQRLVQVLQRLDADEPGVRQALSAKRYLHLATHALVAGNRDALFGSLVLTPPLSETTDSGADGFLQLHEIYDLELQHVELAVLSACETNRGPSVDGEGVFALSRGFLASGARRVIASQWAVDDESTAVLMGTLFTRIVGRERAGRPVDYAEALRDAKRLIRSRPEWADPFHWAPFLLTGKR